MRIVFMGTPEFARKSLERLYNDGHDIVGVFTQADKRRDRGMKLSRSPVKELALSFGTPVYQPVTLKDGGFTSLLSELRCDLLALVAYGKLLPAESLNVPPLGCVNIHGSLLPKYRGPSPIQHAIINGEKETGVTSQYISEKMDTGDILLVKRTPIGEDETSAELFERLSILGAELLGETVEALSHDSIERIPQDHTEATYAPLLTKDMSPIDWTKNPYEIKCMVRGLFPWPVATMELDGKTVRVFTVETTDKAVGMEPGSIVSYCRLGLEVACAGGTVIIKEMQAPGGKRMGAADYLRGSPLLFMGK
jgi:methionyl-tRNA formyltransferase